MNSSIVPPAAETPPPGGDPRRARLAWLTACAALSLLILLLTAWELRLAPLRPGGSWLVLKVLPLLLALPGVLKRRLYTFQWASLLLVVYLGEGALRVASDPGLMSRVLAGAELALTLVAFTALLVYARPYKQAYKVRKKALEAAARGEAA
ncbi:DUF2069 domain-containing protein [Derxia lacustris]|uniref:DUF2069 domain-containing protein n=1 Tax=Derxia lacustris TaxID=764842 RepID=UPI000A1767CD|nr:DUF2069 domain-containing protein [Derxia lacustris]